MNVVGRFRVSYGIKANIAFVLNILRIILHLKLN